MQVPGKSLPLWTQTQLQSKYTIAEIVAILSFLPRDAMLARYYLSSCVCLSVCHKSELYKDG